MSRKKDVNVKHIKLKEKRSRSEKIVENVLSLGWLVIAGATFFSFKYPELNVFDPILDVVKVLMAATIALFLWKSKAENVVRMAGNPTFDRQQLAEELWNEFQESTVADLKRGIGDDY